MAFTAMDVKALREKTGVGMMECKKALTEADGDMDKAVEFLRAASLGMRPEVGKRVVVIGRSLVIGKPVSLLLLAEHATVTICHSRSENLPEICREADILVVAAGKAGMVGAESVRAGQVVLDVGIHVGADGNLCGDTRFAEVEPVVEAITPVPGGVGTVTSTILASHVVEAVERAANQ